MSPYETIQRDGHTLDVLTNAAGDLRLIVSRKGAEPISLARRNSEGEWVGFLYRDGDVSKNSQGWNNHSTVMGYYVHRLLNEKSDYDGRSIAGSTHSFIRHKDFAAPEAGEGSLSYRLPAEKIAAGEYPFQVDLTLTYALTRQELVVTFLLANRKEKTTHVSFGLHPGFGVTSLAEAVVRLPAGRYIRHLAPDNFLSGELEEIVFPGGTMPFPIGDLPGSFLLDLADVPDRVFIVEDPSTGRRTTLDYSEAPYLTLWSDGGPFICVEPCWGLPDHHVQRPFSEKLGIQKIPPHSSLARTFTIRPEISVLPA